ncbi:MAG: GNAT family N-acetyltransferase [Planctomycetia bacterium]|nr:GNAT family N-acetyltransferase [Planctomycetia bacterium]
MEIDLRQHAFSTPELPEGYFVEPWNPALLESHATAHYLSFRNTPDARLFGNFQTFRGCRKVMENIVKRYNFCPAATHLIVYHPTGAFHTECAATIQGVIHADGNGGIQNVGVVPAHQHRGLGHALLALALSGYQKYGVRRATLDVTADNEKALGLYRNIGFIVTQVYYREATPRQQ